MLLFNYPQVHALSSMLCCTVHSCVVISAHLPADGYFVGWVAQKQSTFRRVMVEPTLSFVDQLSCKGTALRLSEACPWAWVHFNHCFWLWQSLVSRRNSGRRNSNVFINMSSLPSASQHRQNFAKYKCFSESERCGTGPTIYKYYLLNVQGWDFYGEIL